MKLVVQDLSEHGAPINICVETEDGERLAIFAATKARHEDDTYDRLAMAERLVAAFNSFDPKAA